MFNRSMYKFTLLKCLQRWLFITFVFVEKLPLNKFSTNSIEIQSKNWFQLDENAYGMKRSHWIQWIILNFLFFQIELIFFRLNQIHFEFFDVQQAIQVKEIMWLWTVFVLEKSFEFEIWFRSRQRNYI